MAGVKSCRQCAEFCGVATKNKRPAAFTASRPVDWLGLTKRWSLYVASNGNSGLLTDLRQADSILTHR